MQLGQVFVIKDNAGVRGHLGGHQGATSGTGQDYLELLAGSACGPYTSNANTTGTMYFPDIKYFSALKNYSVLGTALIELEVTADSITGDNLVKPDISADYNPDISPTSNYLHAFHGDEIFGQFNRVAIYKTAIGIHKGRLLLTKGPSLN